MRVFLRIINIVKRGFHFKQPVIYKLNYVDVLIKEKGLFLISWQFADNYKLSIGGIKKTYRFREGSVVLKMPQHVTELKLVISTWWRTKEYKIHLKKVQVDQAIANQLIQQLKPMPMICLVNENLKIADKKFRTKIATPVYNPQLPLPCLMHPGLATEKFTYPNQ